VVFKTTVTGKAVILMYLLYWYIVIPKYILRGVPGEECCSSLDQTNILYITWVSLLVIDDYGATHWLKPNNLNAEKTCNKHDDEGRGCSSKWLPHY
jgi:hypothetical protein